MEGTEEPISVRLYDRSSIAGRNNRPVVVNSQERQKLGAVSKSLPDEPTVYQREGVHASRTVSRGRGATLRRLLSIPSDGR